MLEIHMDMKEALLPMPSLSYDPENDRIEAFISLTGDFAKLPLNSIKSRLHGERAFYNGALSRWMPGLQRKDFALVVNVDEKPFAECDQIDCVIFGN
jgi:hypothetical protein